MAKPVTRLELNKMWTLLYFLILVLIEGNYALVVDSPSGLISGWLGTSRDGRSYKAYTKVPFAKPPVGNLRFKNPVPYGHWDGLYEATGDPPDCTQGFGGGGISPNNIKGEEDCLYLNVFVPNVNKTGLPVIVSVYGGAFVGGTMGPRNVADYFMDEDLILVTMNYRVGAFGFMSLEDKVFPGNYGLKDQALALQWTKKNIASFGGNQNLITVLGVSAGSASAHHLMLSPVTRDLIKGGVTVSGTANKVWSLKPSGLIRNRTLAAAKVLGCDMKDSQKILNCMQNLDAWKIKDSSGLYPHDIAYGPTIEPEGEGAYIPVDPITWRSKTPWFISFASGERLMKYYRLKGQGQNYVDDISTNRLNEMIGVIAEVKFDETKANDRRILDKIKARYFHPNVTDKAYELGVLFEDVTFVYPALDALERHEGPAYLARFECDIMNTGYNLAMHASEEGLIYNRNPSRSEIQINLSRKYLKLLADFAKYQNPTPDMSWTPWKSNEMLRITCDKSFMSQPEDYAEKENIHGFWKGLFCDPTIEID